MLFKDQFSRLRSRYFFFLLLFLLPALSPAQSGVIDPSFDPGIGINGDRIIATALQADGKIIIGGIFSTYNGINKNSIARLNSDGTLDNTFVGDGVTGGFIVGAITIQPDGKILIGGGFTAYNGTPINRIARLNSDGSLDLTFNPGSGANSDVQKIVIQADGKILIGGGFSSYSGTANYIARLNTDGSFDATFNTGGFGPNNGVGSIAITTDDKIIIGGGFFTYNGIAQKHLARLNADGSLDATFNNGGIGPGNAVSSIAIQSDGKVLISGTFTAYNGTAINRIARLNADGTLDATFNPGLGAGGSAFVVFIRSLAIQSWDGKIVIGGNFTTYNGLPINRIARLNADGTLDIPFSSGTGATGPNILTSVDNITIQPDNKIIIGGDFTAYNSIPRRNIARILNTIIVPLDLISFKGSHSNSGNLLQWKTANEVNTKEFIIEKSIDGQNFTKIATVPAKSNGAGNYSYNDNEQLNGKVYYRLKMVDNDGSFTYSYIVSLSNHKTGTITISPNPVETILTIATTDKNLLKTKISLIDTQGKEIKQFVVENLRQQTDISNIPAGIYFLRLADGTTLQFIKK